MVLSLIDGLLLVKGDVPVNRGLLVRALNCIKLCVGPSITIGLESAPKSKVSGLSS